MPGSQRMAEQKVGLVSLGCAKNLVDSEVMLGLLQEAGYVVTADPKEADAIIVNTCTFIETATSESIDALLEMARFRQGGRCQALILAGCMGTRYGDQLLAELPEVDAVVGTNEVPHIAAVVARALAGERFTSVGAPEFIYSHLLPRIRATRPHTAFVKIAEGCDHRCAFCVIPKVRGAYRSRPMESVVAETRQLVNEGAKEVVAIAQDTTGYGRDLYGELRLAELLDRLADVDGLYWLRLLYAYPTHLSDDVLSVIANRSSICKYVELPLQHVNQRLLAAMRRGGNKDSLARLVDRVRERVPGVVLRTSFIVGYPGETEADFAELAAFVREQRFDHMGVFTYSQEEGTAAAMLPDQVDEATKQERRRVLMEMQQGISRQRNEQLVGQSTEVLVEGRGVGRIARQAPEIDGITYIQGANSPGKVLRCRITAASDYDLVAVAT